MTVFKRNIRPGKLTDVYTDLYDADNMVNSCNPKAIDTFCRLSNFLDKNKESLDINEYNVILKDTQRIKNAFIDNCLI